MEMAGLLPICPAASGNAVSPGTGTAAGPSRSGERTNHRDPLLLLEGLPGDKREDWGRWKWPSSGGGPAFILESSGTFQRGINCGHRADPRC